MCPIRSLSIDILISSHICCSSFITGRIAMGERLKLFDGASIGHKYRQSSIRGKAVPRVGTYFPRLWIGYFANQLPGMFTPSRAGTPPGIALVYFQHVLCGCQANVIFIYRHGGHPFQPGMYVFGFITNGRIPDRGGRKWPFEWVACPGHNRAVTRGGRRIGGRFGPVRMIA